MVLFFSKNGRFVTVNCFSRIGCWNPYLYRVLGCAFFGPSCQKGKFWTPPPKTKCQLIREKFIFGYFLFSWFLISLFGFNFCFCFWFDGLRVLFVLVSFCFVFVFCFCSVFLCGGFKGQVMWPKGPPRLALNPPYCFSCVFSFLVFRSACFPLQLGQFCLFFSVSLCFSLAFCRTSLFNSLFLCLSLSLFLLFVSFFLLSFIFCFSLLFSFVSLFLSLCFLACVFAFDS